MLSVGEWGGEFVDLSEAIVAAGAVEHGVDGPGPVGVGAALVAVADARAFGEVPAEGVESVGWGVPEGHDVAVGGEFGEVPQGADPSDQAVMFECDRGLEQVVLGHAILFGQFGERLRA